MHWVVGSLIQVCSDRTRVQKWRQETKFYRSISCKFFKADNPVLFVMKFKMMSSEYQSCATTLEQLYNFAPIVRISKWIFAYARVQKNYLTVRQCRQWVRENKAVLIGKAMCIESLWAAPYVQRVFASTYLSLLIVILWFIWLPGINTHCILRKLLQYMVL